MLHIQPTPVLRGEEAANFLRRVAEGLKKPARSIPTPRLAEVIEKIRRDRVEQKATALAEALALTLAEETEAPKWEWDERGEDVRRPESEELSNAGWMRKTGANYNS